MGKAKGLIADGVLDKVTDVVVGGAFTKAKDVILIKGEEYLDIIVKKFFRDLFKKNLGLVIIVVR